MTPTASHARAVFAFELARLDLAKATDTPKLERRVERAVRRWLRAILPGLVDWAMSELPEPSAEKVSYPAIRARARGALAKKDFPDLDAEQLYALLVGPIEAAFRDGVGRTAGVIGIDLDSAPQLALAFAQERAAELVGMKRLTDGTLIVNPNPRWAITDTVRAMVRGLTSTALEDGWAPQDLADAIVGALGKPRAMMVARTEVAIAQGSGAAEAYESAGVELVEIYDGEGCLPEGHDDDAPAASGLPGVVELEHQANGQIWTVAQYRQYVTGHPNCVRGSAPYLSAA